MVDSYHAVCWVKVEDGYAPIYTTEHSTMRGATDELGFILMKKQTDPKCRVWVRFYQNDQIVAMYYGRQMAKSYSMCLWAFAVEMDEKYE